MNKKTISLIIGIIVVGVLGYGHFAPKESGVVSSDYLPNKVDVVYKVNLAEPEKAQITKSVDDFMNEYKLPKGIQNSYAVLVEKRLNDTLQVVTNPEQTDSDFHATIYLRKVDGVWQVDSNAGPWCTLEQFEQRDC